MNTTQTITPTETFVSRIDPINGEISIVQFRDADDWHEIVWVEGNNNFTLTKEWKEFRDEHDYEDYDNFTDFVEDFMESFEAKTGRKWGFICYDISLSI